MMLPTDNEYRIISEGLLSSTSGYHSNNSSLQGLQNAFDYCKHIFFTITSKSKIIQINSCAFTTIITLFTIHIHL